MANTGKEPMLFTLEEVACATGGTLLGSGVTGVSGVSTDSRSVQPGELFVALRGERYDGHDFVAAVAAADVRCFLVAADWPAVRELPTGTVAVVVADTLRALGDLAAWHRRRFDLPVAAVTGSNGKTTTKEMLAAILAETGPGLKTEGNLNNLIGLPLTVFRLSTADRWGVLEMGMSEFGEIDRLAEIGAPFVGVVTNAYPAHLETLGTVEGVARAKGELFLRLPAGGWAIYNADDPLVSRLPVPDGVRRLGFGLQGGEVQGVEIQPAGRNGQRYRLRLPTGEISVELQALGRHNVANAVAAAAAASALAVPPAAIGAGLARFLPFDRRFRPEPVNGILLIDDSYNANPASMAAALLTLRDVRGDGRALAVLGDMLELGAEARKAHRDVGRLAATCVDRLYLLGELAPEVAAGALEAGLEPEQVTIGTDHEELLARLLRGRRAGDAVLVKGSRGMRMDRVAEGLRQALAASRTGGSV
jgi:UDP-N-acetylmuramoyl-tripeptide--D-alanyl-D-alanine ligase